MSSCRQSIITDVNALHNSWLLSKASDIYGLRYHMFWAHSCVNVMHALLQLFISSTISDPTPLCRYDVQTGGITEISRRPPNGKPKHQRTA